MRLRLILPVVEPGKYEEPKRCVDSGCGGRHFRLRQEVVKNVRDMQYEQVRARRYECLRCGSTFRVYPAGVLGGQFSQRVKGVGGNVVRIGSELWGSGVDVDRLGGMDQ